MGGFARYPWPQFRSHPPFLYNKYYKRAMGVTIFGTAVTFLWVYRYTNYHNVDY